MKTLETKRLWLRELQDTDVNDMYEYAKSPVIGPAAGWKPHETIEETAKILTMLKEGNEAWAIVDKATGKMIGTYGLHSKSDRNIETARMVGYVLSEAYWGQGLIVEATEAVLKFAFDILGMDIISVIHYPCNVQSRRVIEKCGFRYEGTLRMAARLYDGSICDHVCYSMTKDEWNKRNRP